MDNLRELTPAFSSKQKSYLGENNYKPEKKYELKVSAIVISRYLYGCTLFLVIAHLSAFAMGLATKSKSVWLIYFQYYFNMEGENNVPTFFSSILLLLAAGILLFIRAIEKTNKYYWLSLSGIFLFLSLDEALEIHEKVNIFAQKYLAGRLANFINLPWVIPYAIVFGVVGVIFLKFLKALPAKTQKAILISGSIYVLAAAGIEALDGILFKYYTYEHIIFRLTSFVQETLEMVGIILFIKGLIEYIQSKFESITITAR